MLHPAASLTLERVDAFLKIRQGMVPVAFLMDYVFDISLKLCKAEQIAEYIVG